MRYCDSDRQVVAPHPDGPDPWGRGWRSRGEAPEGGGWGYTAADGSRTELRVCPVPQRPTWWPELYQVYQLYEQGHLLWPGGVADQSRPYLLVMRYIASTLADLLDAKAESGKDS